MKFFNNISSYIFRFNCKICIKPLSIDRIVSQHIRKFGAWEPKLVNSVLKMVQRFPEATFLGWSNKLLDLNFLSFHPNLSDIGSNIGMFSLAVAALNRSVVAVDADPVNLAYIRQSLSLGSHSHHVRTINNAVG